jgi:hypothetical protein
MSKKSGASGRWIVGGIALSGLGSAVVTVPSSARKYLPSGYGEHVDALDQVGLFLIVLGVLLAIVSAVLWVFRRVSETVVVEFNRGRYHYYQVQAGVGDLDRLYEFYEDLFGRDLVPQNEFSRWISKNPKIAYIVMRVKRDPGANPEAIGFFDLEPLTSRGAAKLRTARPNTLSLEVSDISSERRERARDYYVGSVGAKKDSSDFIRGMCLAFLVGTVQKLASERSITLYARPATDQGLYLVRELFGFSKIQTLPDKEAVWTHVITEHSDFGSFGSLIRRVSK